MEVHGSTPFTELLGTGPVVIRQFLRSALRLNDIEDLYAQARKSNANSLSKSVLEVLNVSVQVSDQDIQRIPSSGPVIIVANHPFGLLDGLALDQVLLRSRSDVKILVNELVCGLNEMKDRCIPVDVFQAGAGHETNVKAAREALKWLHNGHGIATFPSGEVSHWRHHEKCITDPPWSIFAVRCARKANASIVPVYFKGENSLAFQMAGLLHPRLRTARLPIELLNKRASTVEVRIGRPVAVQELRDAGSDELATRYVRARVYMLSRRMAAPPKPGTLHKFFRTGLPPSQPVSEPAQGAAAEIARLDAMGRRGRRDRHVRGVCRAR
jgi:putative hemolysin